jgi:carotenoid cleavage dioxygenase
MECHARPVTPGNVDTSGRNDGNPYRTGNMLPLAAESTHGELRVIGGAIPADLDGIFVRNGTNQRFAPTGQMHMYDDDAMLHCVRLRSGRAEAYSNTWLRTPRFDASDAAGRELYATFGDLAHGGLEVHRYERCLNDTTMRISHKACLTLVAA